MPRRKKPVNTKLEEAYIMAKLLKTMDRNHFYDIAEKISAISKRRHEGGEINGDKYGENKKGD